MGPSSEAGAAAGAVEANTPGICGPNEFNAQCMFLLLLSCRGLRSIRQQQKASAHARRMRVGARTHTLTHIPLIPERQALCHAVNFIQGAPALTVSRLPGQTGGGLSPVRACNDIVDGCHSPDGVTSSGS